MTVPMVASFAALCEMAFATRCGLDIELQRDALAELFNEELGVLVQVAEQDRAAFEALLASHDLASVARPIARPRADARIRVQRAGATLSDHALTDLLAIWHSVSHAMQLRRDDPAAPMRSASQCWRVRTRCRRDCRSIRSKTSPRRSSTPARVRSWRSCASRA